MNIHSLKSIAMWNLTEECLTWGKVPHNMKCIQKRLEHTHLSSFHSLKIGDKNWRSCHLLSGLWLMPDFRDVTPSLSLINFKGIWRQVKALLDKNPNNPCFSLYKEMPVLSNRVLRRSWTVWRTSEVRNEPTSLISLNCPSGRTVGSKLEMVWSDSFILHTRRQSPWYPLLCPRCTTGWQWR